MDSSRNNDLAELRARYKDTQLTKTQRIRSWRNFQRVLRQSQDTTLVELRHRLIRARRAKDDRVSEKIELQIEEHIKRNHHKDF